MPSSVRSSTTGNVSSTRPWPKTPTRAPTSHGSKRTTTVRPKTRSRRPTISPKNSNASCRTRPTTRCRSVASVFDNARQWLAKARCCPPPPIVTGVLAQAGGGSGEAVGAWDPLPASAHVAFYRVYQRKATGLYWHLAVVTPAALGALVAGRFGIVDAAD